MVTVKVNSNGIESDNGNGNIEGKNSDNGNRYVNGNIAAGRALGAQRGEGYNENGLGEEGVVKGGREGGEGGGCSSEGVRVSVQLACVCPVPSTKVSSTKNSDTSRGKHISRAKPSIDHNALRA